jgi:SecD/SecF fusion protein
MHRRLRQKLAVVLLVLAGVSAFAWLPPVADRLGLHLPEFFAGRRLRLGLDLTGGVQFVLRVNVDEALGVDETVTRDEIVARARETVDRRINALGVLEPLIVVQGERRDELLVQLPGFTDVERARSILGQTARLEWRLVEPAPGASPAVTGRDIRRAWLTRDDFGQPAVGFSLTPEGGRRFAGLTSRHTGKPLAIVLDDEVVSAPVIESAITSGEGIIRGFSMKEAADLALLLQAGALPVSMTFLGGEYVGPTLGVSTVRSGLAASAGSLVLVSALMVLYYRRAGVNAVLSVVANLSVLAGLMASLGSAVTLPGVAGMILTIGMGVDSNVLVFERIKDELRTGQSIRRAVVSGFDRVFLTILDTHVTSLIAAAFLFQFGSGAVRGFATSLALGLLANVFTAVALSRTMFELSLSFGRRVTFGADGFAGWLTRHPIHLMQHRALALGLSAAVVAAGVTVTAVRGLPLGLDFTGGTAVVTDFVQPVSEDAVRLAMPDGWVVQRYGAKTDRTLQIRLPLPAGATDGDDPGGPAAVESALSASGLPQARIVGTSTIGPSIGRDFQRRTAYALTGALIGVSTYVAVRFRPGFALGAALATSHDLVVTVAALSLAGHDLDLNVVAALLTVAGYSVNDTIVVFDRVRERVRTSGRRAIERAIDTAVMDTLGRTIITSGTTLAAVMGLYVFGGAALESFAFAVLTGIVAGTWSTVCVAAPVAALAGRRAGKADANPSGQPAGRQ